MNIAARWIQRQLACCLALFIAVPSGMAATTPQTAAPQPAAAATTAQPQQQTNSAGVAKSNSSADQPASSPAASYPDAPVPVLSASASQDQQIAQSSTQQTTTPQPVGTAAAPYLKPEGVSASRPAGAAIAPAKQRRIRTFAIRIALLVGAGVAIGTVAALSLGSPSRAH